MQTSFDLLRRVPDGSFIWIETSADLVLGRTRLRELAFRAPGEYVLFDQSSQETIEKGSSPNLGSWARSGTSDPRFARPE